MEIAKHCRLLFAQAKEAEDRAANSNHVNTEEIWRAARQLIDSYPREPEAAALQFADAALEFGDFCIFLFWRKVALGVKVLRGNVP